MDFFSEPELILRFYKTGLRNIISVQVVSSFSNVVLNMSSATNVSSMQAPFVPKTFLCISALRFLHTSENYYCQMQVKVVHPLGEMGSVARQGILSHYFSLARPHLGYWKASLTTMGGLELDDLYCPFQPRPFCMLLRKNPVNSKSWGKKIEITISDDKRRSIFAQGLNESALKSTPKNGR